MTLASAVATVMLAILIAFVGMVLWATFRQVQSERHEAAERDA